MTTMEDEVRRTLQEHAADDYDPTDLLARVREEIGVGGSPRAARRGLWTPLVAAAVAILVAGGGWWLSSGDSRPTAATPRTAGPTAASVPTRHTVPTPPPGTKFVGYRGVMFAVPAGLTTAQCPVNRHGTIGFPGTVESPPCPLPLAARLFTSISFVDSIVGPPDLLARAVSGGEIGGNQVLLTPVVHVVRRGDYYRQSVAVPAQHFYVTVSAPHQSTVNRIIGSVQAVPTGCTVVPQLIGRDDRRVYRTLRSAGLRPGRIAPDPSLGPPGSHRVTTQSPDPGSVVVRGTRVGLSFGP